MQILGIILEKQHKDGFQGTLAEIEPVVSLQNGSIKCNLAIVRVMFELKVLKGENTFTIFESDGICKSMNSALKIGKELEKIGYENPIARIDDQCYTMKELSRLLEAMTLPHGDYDVKQGNWMPSNEGMELNVGLKTNI